MAYITADEVSAIRTALKAKFPKLKFGCRKSSGSLAVDVTIKSGDIDFIGNYNKTIASRARANDPLGPRPAKDNLSINQYWYKEHFQGDVAKVVGEIINVVKTAPNRKWYDNSDAMTDYFDTAYYFNINVGAWDKPYILTK